jgi:hypothetical protein
LVYFTAIWYILRPFGIFYGHLVMLWSFGIFFPVLVYCVKTNLATMLLGSYLNVTNSTVKAMYFFDKNGLGYVLGDFFRKLVWSHCRSSMKMTWLDSNSESPLFRLHFRSRFSPTTCRDVFLIVLTPMTFFAGNINYVN